MPAAAVKPTGRVLFIKESVKSEKREGVKEEGGRILKGRVKSYDI